MNTEAKVECNVYSRKQLAEYLGMHENTIYKSDIPRICIGGRVLYRKTSVEKWLRERESTNGKSNKENKFTKARKKQLVIPLGDY
jgi:hypothetical protein